MQFTEIGYAIFLLAVFSLYHLALGKHVRGQNVLILSASYLFYGWWDWRFLGLILATTVTTFVSSLYARGSHGKTVVTLNIVFNLLILLSFKYLGFFAENLQRLLAAFGWNMDWFTIEILLPVGISFYTFQAIGYSVDVYKGRIEPCRDLLSFATFIAYFPQLVAGPIERAANLLPQIQRPRAWDYGRAVTGLRMILFGVLKKVCVADPVSMYVDSLYGSGLGSATVCLRAGIFFAIEIYCDFSAYSEIARGSSRLLGIELIANFRFPYFARNIIEAWRRWHISLMQWFRDYVYIPLGGSRRGRGRTSFNLAAVFLLSGLWHGAGWNFILWGAYWAAVYIFGKAVLKLKNRSDAIKAVDLPSIMLTFMAFAFGFYIFRCTVGCEIICGFRNLWIYIAAAVVMWAAAKCLTSRPARIVFANKAFVAGLAAVLLAAFAYYFVGHWQSCVVKIWMVPLVLVFAIEWISRNADYPLAVLPRSRGARFALYWIMMVLVSLSEPIDMNFIYFQF